MIKRFFINKNGLKKIQGKGKKRMQYKGNPNIAFKLAA